MHENSWQDLGYYSRLRGSAVFLSGFMSYLFHIKSSWLGRASGFSENRGYLRTVAVIRMLQSLSSIWRYILLNKLNVYFKHEQHCAMVLRVGGVCRALVHFVRVLGGANWRGFSLGQMYCR